MRLPRSSQSDGCARFCLCTHVFFLPYKVFMHPHIPVLKASDTCDSSAPCPTPQSVHTCPTLLQRLPPCALGLHLPSQVPNLFSLSFCRNHFNSSPVWLASLRCPPDPWPFAHSSHSQSSAGHFCKGQC